MIVLKATQDKVLAVLQSVAGIVERQHALLDFGHYAVIRRTGTFKVMEPAVPAVQLYAPEQSERDAAPMCKTRLSRRLAKGTSKRRRQARVSCWHRVGDSSTKRKRLTL